MFGELFQSKCAQFALSGDGGLGGFGFLKRGGKQQVNHQGWWLEKTLNAILILTKTL
jgi:hypothetical protein